MIILGIIAIFLGGILYINGNAINNDIDARMESIFNDGISSPGSTYETFGVLLLVVGFALLIIGVIVSVNKNKEESTPSSDMGGNNTQTIKEQSLVCKKCGASVTPESKFCMECGEPLAKKQEGTSIVCPHCGGSNPQESKYCMHCGKSHVEPPKSAPWICSNCGTENEADYIFCSNCKTTCGGKKE